MAEVTFVSQPSLPFLWDSALEKFPLNSLEVPQNHMKDDIYNESILSQRRENASQAEMGKASAAALASPAEMALVSLLITAMKSLHLAP